MGHCVVNEEDRESFRAYMLGVEWLYEIEGDFGTAIYPSIDALWDNHSLSYFRKGEDYPQDGIVEVEIRFIRHIPAEKCKEEVEKSK